MRNMGLGFDMMELSSVEGVDYLHRLYMYILDFWQTLENRCVYCHAFGFSRKSEIRNLDLDLND